MQDLVIIKRLKLKYEGTILGYRITLNNSEKEYDISSKELTDLSRDWDVRIIDGTTYTLDMYAKDGKLYTKDGSDAETITYLDIVDKIKGYDDINIMGVDIF